MSNREISLVYNKEILQRLENLIPPSTAISVQEAIFSGDNARLKAQIQALLIQSVSSFDTAPVRTSTTALCWDYAPCWAALS